MKKNILIIGLVFVFLWFGVDKLVHPDYWMGWIPSWMDGLFGLRASVLNKLAALAEIGLAVLLIVPQTRRVAAGLLTLYLLFIIIALTRLSPVGIRDIGLFSAALYVMLKKSD